MAKSPEALIELAKGPYIVTAETGPILADRITFRHFRRMELLIGREFIRRAIIPGEYYFDVYLFTEEALDWMRRMPEELWRAAVPYAHRIDAVCFRPEEVALIEFKPRLKYSAIGQLLGYRDWFRRQYKPDKPLRLVTVCLYDRPELHETCAKEGIEVILLKREGWATRG